MRIASLGHAFFAFALIAAGVIGFVGLQYAALWQPIPRAAPALADVCAVISLACGTGLLWQRTAAASARVLLAWLLLWLLVVRVPQTLLQPASGIWWSACQIAALAAAAWVLYVWFASDWDRRRLGFAAGKGGLRIARVLCGVALIPWGLAHFIYPQNTVSLVPSWLPWHLFWADFTGVAFMAAGLALLTGVCSKLAAVLATAEIGLFTLLVWVPIMARGHRTVFHWTETIVSVTLTAATWVVAESWRRQPSAAALEDRSTS
ncbi:MAG TPA: hypothetical protein VL990_17905 [Acidobacteriaceae bacterium]|nr:hypothetical protein [Acidobacteriaceae bacterium]